MRVNDTHRAARSRQLARVGDDQKPPAPRAALALAKAEAYQSAAARAALARITGTLLERVTPHGLRAVI